MKPLVEPGAPLSAAEAGRYARHLTLPGVGEEGQRRLRAARVLVIGAGGLGAPTLLYLAAAGVGTLGVIDDDVVDLSNLQRQVLHRTEDLGRPKAESARDALLRLDPALHVEAYVDRLDGDNALELFGAYDLVLDGADNFGTRYLANDAAELTGTPLVWGSIFRFQGQVSVFWPGEGPMLRDLFPDIPPAGSVPSCADGGVFGALCGSIGSAMATEAIKVICGLGEPLVGRVLVHDALRAEQHTLRLVPDPDRPPVTELTEAIEACAATAQPRVDSVTVTEVAAARREGAAPVLLDVREEWERRIVTVPDDRWVPLDQVRTGGWASVAAAVDGAREVIVYCRSGVRSAQAVGVLQDQAPDGVRVRNMTGGVLAWSREFGGPAY
ncbi:molybdopterin-synthase adenylyltransferase MoeB [Raineyella sp. LH-20]|uniref:molybdopterin-synthase adenylyltransferase MoeB n=1 Tax=Raineyella sp. LH-20 TaxID=3081204 RepID=UPI002952C895|nr:molybdopterin-synthase adenylyltransferase MoeB [Raineyella sp. LH-20]WOP17480.1 molybdopterin-synthase adenylyltransferase MoeB [Raineyella sp. LH-20]